MECQKCGSERVMEISGKTSDRCITNYKDVETDGYVPYDVGIGGGDYLDFSYCLECGQIQGEWPVEDPEIEEDEDY